MENTAMILKLPALMIKREGDFKQLLKDWEEYIDKFKIFLGATAAIAAHDNPEVVGMPCATCQKTKMLMILVGGSEVKRLFNHIRKVTETDTWNETLDNISRGIEGQINQARFKSTQRMPRNEEGFVEWYLYGRDQVEWCNWPGYDTDTAARDTILLRTRGSKLKQKILP